MDSKVDNSADPAAVPALASPDLAQRIVEALDAGEWIAGPNATRLQTVAGIIRAALQQEQFPHAHTWIYNRVMNAMICSCGERIECDHRLPAAMEATAVLMQEHSEADFVAAHERAEGAEAELETLKSAVSRAGETWQPISSAPKDGTEILAYDEGAMMLTCWLEDEGAWWDNGAMNPAPTHWMPLPDPPQDATTDK